MVMATLSSAGISGSGLDETMIAKLVPCKGSHWFRFSKKRLSWIPRYPRSGRSSP